MPPIKVTKKSSALLAVKIWPMKNILISNIMMHSGIRKIKISKEVITLFFNRTD